MPFVFAVLGILFLVVALQDTQSQAFGLLKSELTGSNNFVIFAAAIVIMGALAYIQPIRKPMFAMIGLVLLAMILRDKGGFFAQLNNAIRNPVTPAQPVANAGGNIWSQDAATQAVQAPTNPNTGQRVPYFGLTPTNNLPFTGLQPQA